MKAQTAHCRWFQFHFIEQLQMIYGCLSRDHRQTLWECTHYKINSRSVTIVYAYLNPIDLLGVNCTGYVCQYRNALKWLGLPIHFSWCHCLLLRLAIVVSFRQIPWFESRLCNNFLSYMSNKSWEIRLEPKRYDSFYARWFGQSFYIRIIIRVFYGI